MKPFRSHFLTGSIARLCRLSLLVPFAGSAFASTLLTMDGMPHNATIPAAFADFAAFDGTGYTLSLGVDGFVGTPNIELGWPGIGHSFDSYQNWDNRGTVLQIDTETGSTVEIPFTPNSASFGVLITRFELDEYSNGGNMAVNWSIMNGPATIVSGTWTRNSGGRDLIETGMTFAQAQANAGAPITLRFERTSGLHSYLAVDNLAFDQVNAVPEPATAALGVLGLGALAMRRRRKVS